MTRTGCTAGCGNDGHDCGAQDRPKPGFRAPRDQPTPCIGRCHAADVATLVHWGDVYGGCPCGQTTGASA